MNQIYKGLGQCLNLFILHISELYTLEKCLVIVIELIILVRYNVPEFRDITGHRFNIATSYGTCHGQHSFALGLSGLNERGTLIYRVSGSLNTKGNVAFGLGIGYQFDGNNRVNDTEHNKIAELELKLKEQESKYNKYVEKTENHQKEVDNVINKLLKEIEELKNMKK